MTTAYEALALIDTVRAGAAEGRVFSRWADGFLSLRHRFLRCRPDRIGQCFDRIGIRERAYAVGDAGAGTGWRDRDRLHHDRLCRGDGKRGGRCEHGDRLARSRHHAGAATPDDHADPAGRAATAQRPHRRCRHWPAPSNSFGSAAVWARQTPPVLEDVSISIAPGEHIGIAGPFRRREDHAAEDLLGLMRPQSGHVLFDGRDLDGLDAAALRRQIGVIGQGGRLFPGTLLDNIAAGAALTSEQAMAAVRIAGLEADIAALPLGLATPIGDTDCGFSGGQVQRLLLARAFATRPKMLVLDEATSCARSASFSPTSPRRLTACGQRPFPSPIASTRCRRATGSMCSTRGASSRPGSYAELAAGGGLFAAMRFAEASATAARIVPQAANPVHAAIETVQAAFT